MTPEKFMIALLRPCTIAVVGDTYFVSLYTVRDAMLLKLLYSEKTSIKSYELDYPMNYDAEMIDSTSLDRIVAVTFDTIDPIYLVDGCIPVDDLSSTSSDGTFGMLSSMPSVNSKYSSLIEMTTKDFGIDDYPTTPIRVSLINYTSMVAESISALLYQAIINGTITTRDIELNTQYFNKNPTMYCKEFTDAVEYRVIKVVKVQSSSIGDMFAVESVAVGVFEPIMTDLTRVKNDDGFYRYPLLNYRKVYQDDSEQEVVVPTLEGFILTKTKLDLANPTHDYACISNGILAVKYTSVGVTDKFVTLSEFDKKFPNP